VIHDTSAPKSVTTAPPQALSSPSSEQALLDDDFDFPLYTVGPATSRALNTLVHESSSRPSSPFTKIRPRTFGEHTGNGDALAQYILHHYNTLHSQRVYTFYEAPRLPFTPLIGPPRGERMLKEDARLRKKPLLFLVGEQRRDIIPKTLTDTAKRLPEEERIPVDEVEVYVTRTMASFQGDFTARLKAARKNGQNTVVVVVFSPQGCEAMLRSLGYIDDQRALTASARQRWSDSAATLDDDHQPEQPSETPPATQQRPRYVIATIGPTTRDHLRNQYSFEPDVCAAKPSPQGVGSGVVDFLRSKGLGLS
jgi:uroporphyrinogen-III synthase